MNDDATPRNDTTLRITCPTCGRTCEGTREQLPHRPFCSPRCKLADLGKWLDEDFRVSRPLGPDDTE